MIISWYLKKNGEDGHLGDDPNHVVIDVPEKDITDNDTNGSNENDDGCDVGIDDDDEDKDDDENGSEWCYYWYYGCFFLSPCY